MAQPRRKGVGDDPNRSYQSPLASRYASQEMRELFSAHRRAVLWRQLWLALAEVERELGLKIPKAPLRELARRIQDVDFKAVARYEKQFRHDVMAHLHTFADLHPPARPWLHLGATSCFVTDNADLMVFRNGLELIRDALGAVIGKLAEFAERHKALPALGYTHFQPAQPTTVGKRACLWIQDLLMDLEEIERLIRWLPLRGVKGTTGTQASFLALFDGDHQKVKKLDKGLAHRLGFERCFAVTGQTYPRKVDSRILSVLSGVAQSAAKAGADLRLLAHERELEEPYESKQIGSSAMAYKRNPMRAERMCSLARFVVHLPANAADTASQQWLERTLDDSANRRIVMAEGFLALDSVLRIYHSIADGLIVNEPMVRAHLDRELPFLCTEEVMMRATKKGGDRQLLHERIRVHSRAAVERLKGGAANNDLFERLAKDPAFKDVRDEFEEMASADRLVGRAPRQVGEFLRSEVKPALRKLSGRPGRKLQELDV